MAMEELLRKISLRAARMSASERISRIRELAVSEEDAKFIEDHFPELYREAFPPVTSGVGRSSVSGRPHRLAAKQL